MPSIVALNSEKPVQALPYFTLSRAASSSANSLLSLDFSSLLFLSLVYIILEQAMASPSPILDYMPVGFRFRPTDEELVGHYLKHKLLGENFLVQIIREIDICKHEPWDLPAFSVIKSEDPEWFFFSPRDFKYSNSSRANRATERGFWKATGKDRNIKVRGTNHVIGTKKTLVFYEGRVPHGVKTNWVIHEYHAVTFHVNERTFVLSRLMKKPEKNEERTDEFVCDEGEPSNYMASDHENQVTAHIIQDVYTLPAVNLESILTPSPTEEYDLPSIQQSPIVIEQELSFQASPFPNVSIRNDNSSMHLTFETTEEEDNDEFVNSLFVDEDVYISEERRHAFVNDSNPSESLRMVYYESSDTDVEAVSSLVKYGNILDTSTVCKEYTGSTDFQLMKMVKSSHGAEHAGAAQMSSNHGANREKKHCFFQDDYWGADASIGDSTAAKPLEINCIEIDSSSSTLRRCKTQYQPRSDNSVSQRAGTRRSQTQRKVSRKPVSHHEAQKETLVVESNKYQRKAQGNISRNTLESPSNQSSDVNRRGSFIYLETPSLSQNLNPRSVYLVNVVIGFSLFIVTIWELLSYGRCC